MAVSVNDVTELEYEDEDGDRRQTEEDDEEEAAAHLGELSEIERRLVGFDQSDVAEALEEHRQRRPADRMGYGQ